jgi:hypothetical protein
LAGMELCIQAFGINKPTGSAKLEFISSLKISDVLVLVTHSANLSEKSQFLIAITMS